jgi:ABC-type multidrug transport system fused ATPase/permease subunit
VAGRLLDLLDVPELARHDQSEAVPSPALVPIRFEGVSYRYPSRTEDAVRDVDLELSPGETVALIGASGGGKTTLLSLLQRFAEPTSGRILVGEVDLAEVDAASWRRRIALVPQQPTLFRGTIADNIRLGDPSADAEHVRAAAELAGAHDFVSRLERGYATIVGEGGRQLSTGQRRRLALARAALRDAPLILLDEPTADLDPVNVQVVGDAVDRLRVGRTVLMVTHSPELAARADRVLGFEGGRVHEVASVAA